MANFALGNQEIVDSLNYILSGTPAIGQQGDGVSFTDEVYLNNTGSPPYTLPAPPVGGMPFDTDIYTDLNVQVTVKRPQDIVFVSSQCRTFVDWTAANPADIVFGRCQLVRYDPAVGTPTLLVSRAFSLDESIPTEYPNGFLGDLIFQTIIDRPGVGIWEYSVIFNWDSAQSSPGVTIDDMYVTVRSVNANIIKP